MLRILLAVSTLFLVAAAPDPAEPSFCARLAPKLKMKPVGDTPASPPTTWKVNLMGGLGPALFGGSTSASFSLQPVDGVDYPDPSFFRGACKSNPKGATCALRGPAEFTIGTKKGDVIENVRSGEQPTVEMRGTTIHCRDGQAAPAT